MTNTIQRHVYLLTDHITGEAAAFSNVHKTVGAIASAIVRVGYMDETFDAIDIKRDIMDKGGWTMHDDGGLMLDVVRRKLL